MSKQFKCVKAWSRHSVGEIIPESEYNRLPFEIKQHGNFEEVPSAIEVPFPESFLALSATDPDLVVGPFVVEPKYLTLNVSETNPAALDVLSSASDVPVEATIDLLADDEKPKVKNKKY